MPNSLDFDKPLLWRLITGWAMMAMALSVVPAAEAQELLSNPSFAAGQPAPTVQGWKILESTGGSVRLRTDTMPPTAHLTSERVSLPDGGETWQAALTIPGKIEVVPGCRYRFQCEARGNGPFHLGLMEYGWRYSEQVLHVSSRNADLTSKFETVTFEYTPSADRVAFVRPFLRLDGWLKRVELRSASFVPLLGKGDVSIRTGHFVVSPGEELPLTLNASSFPIKLLLYGLSGDSGPGGPMSGAGAYADQCVLSTTQENKAGAANTLTLSLPPTLKEGAYRLVAVEPNTGAMATAWFDVMSKSNAKELLDLVQHAHLPRGSRIVFLGDSLTAFRPGRNYTSILARAFRWRFGEDVEVINAGVGGNTIVAMAARLDKDVIQRNPTHVFIQEGANSTKRYYDPKDNAMRGWAVSEQDYEATWRDVLTRLTQHRAKVVVMTMVPGEREVLDAFESTARAFGDTGNFWCQPEDVRKAAELQERLAREFRTEMIDLHRVFNSFMLERARQGGTSYLHVDDGVHLSEHGNREIAKAILRHLAAP